MAYIGTAFIVLFVGAIIYLVRGGKSSAGPSNTTGGGSSGGIDPNGTSKPGSGTQNQA